MRTPLQLMRYADRALGDALLAGTPATFGARSAEDTLRLHAEQAALLLRRGDAARVRALLAQGLTLAQRLSAATTPQHLEDLWLPHAWFAAARGDPTEAERALTASDATFGAEVRAQPGGTRDAALTCTRAEVAGHLGDVAAMLAPLRRCLTMANGYPASALASEPAFARHAGDPRVRALAAELAEAQARARSTPVSAAPPAR